LRRNQRRASAATPALLMHDAREGGYTTVDAVRLVVPALRAQGFQLATVSDVL